MTRGIGVEVGNKIGNVMKVNVDEDDIGWCRFLIIKVEADIIMPLMRGTLLNFQGNQYWIPFK